MNDAWLKHYLGEGANQRLKKESWIMHDAWFKHYIGAICLCYAARQVQIKGGVMNHAQCMVQALHRSNQSML